MINELEWHETNKNTGSAVKGACVLSPAFAKLWDGARDHEVVYHGFDQNQQVGVGGGLVVVAMQDSGGVWRKRTWGRGYVVGKAKDTLLSIPSAQRFGMGAEFLPAGGANIRCGWSQVPHDAAGRFWYVQVGHVRDVVAG